MNLELLAYGVNIVAYISLMAAMRSDLMKMSVSNRIFQFGFIGTLVFSGFGGLQALLWTLGVGVLFFLSGFLQQLVTGWGESDTAAFALLGFGSLHLDLRVILGAYIAATLVYVGWKLKPYFVMLNPQGNPEEKVDEIAEMLMAGDIRIAFIPVIAFSYTVALAVYIGGILL